MSRQEGCQEMFNIIFSPTTAMSWLWYASSWYSWSWYASSWQSWLLNSPHEILGYGMLSNGIPDDGMPPHGIPDHGMPPHDIPGDGLPPHDIPDDVMPPHDIPGDGMPPHGIPSEICLLMKFLVMVYLLMVGIPGDCTVYFLMVFLMMLCLLIVFLVMNCLLMVFLLPSDGMPPHGIPC